MTPKTDWIDLAERSPEPGRFVRVEVRERVDNHWLTYEGQARYDPDHGWLKTDSTPYLAESQEIRRWKPLLDGGGNGGSEAS